MLSSESASSNISKINTGLHKYSPAVYEACIYSFQSLPVTALIDGKFFCVHGGISPELQVLSDLDKVRLICIMLYHIS